MVLRERGSKRSLSDYLRLFEHVCLEATVPQSSTMAISFSLSLARHSTSSSRRVSRGTLCKRHMTLVNQLGKVAGCRGHQKGRRGTPHRTLSMGHRDSPLVYSPPIVDRMDSISFYVSSFRGIRNRAQRTDWRLAGGCRRAGTCRYLSAGHSRRCRRTPHLKTSS